MKKLMALFGLLVGSLLTSQSVSGQTLASDQNPNYRVSMVRYMTATDSLTQTMSTTVQDTYKAYDWYEAKQERKALRRQNRHDVRMERAKYNRNFYGYDTGYYGNYNTNYYSRWSNWNSWRPNIGFRTGNWWFSI